MKSTVILLITAFMLTHVNVYSQIDNSDKKKNNVTQNDGLDSPDQIAPLLSKADPEVYENMPPELKDIRLLSTHIEIMSDDYNMGDWQESPSKIIYHEDWYHMWIIDIPQGERKEPGFSTTTYMKSRDGILWHDQGKLPLGEEGSIDDAMRLAPDVVRYEGRFYMFYEPMTTNIEKYRQRRCGIAALVADHPEGPWTYATEELLLTPTIDDPDAWDHLFVANPRIEYLNGKWFIYYKARNEKTSKTKNGVATSDNLLGPYTKYEGNPLVGGHSANLIKYKNGLIYMNYHKHAFYWTEDGFTFVEIKKFGKGTGMAEEMNWSTFFLPNNPLYGGDPSLPDATSLWGVSSRWANRELGYNRFNNDIIGATLILKE